MYSAPNGAALYKACTFNSVQTERLEVGAEDCIHGRNSAFMSLSLTGNLTMLGSISGGKSGDVRKAFIVNMHDHVRRQRP